MPTENRSSNTEMVSELLPCPFCGKKDFLIERLDSDASVVICQGLTGPHAACLARGPVGVAQDEGEEQPGRDKAVELWNARAEQHQGEPVTYQIRSKTDRPDSQWTPWRECCETTRAMHSHEVGRFNQHGIMREIRPVFTHADPAEVERLRSIERSYGLREALLEQVKGERDRMIARTLELADQLANQDALLHKLKETLQREYWDEYAGLDETRELIDSALAASAEPGPVIAWHVGGNGYDRICFEKPADLPGQPCIHAIHDQRQLIDLLKRYDLRDEDVPPDERVHGIPGTQFQRLNALANEGE